MSYATTTSKIASKSRIRYLFTRHLLEMYLGITLIVILGIILIEPLRIDDDNAIFLEIGGRILDGQIPYVDFFEVNFPFFYYFNIPLVAVARAIGINPIPVFLIFMWLLTIWSTLTTRHLLRYLYPRESRIPTTVALVIALLTLFLLAQDFGEREHIFVLLFFPGFILRWLRRENVQTPTWYAAIIGIAAGTGIAIKPHFLLIAFVPEIYWLVRSRNIRDLFRPEVYGLGSVLILYLLSFLLIPATMRDAFFNDMVPSLIADYDAYGFDRTWYQDPRTWHILVLFSVTIWFSGRKSGDLWNLVRPLALASLVGWIIWVIQGKFWDYQYIGAQLFALMTIAVLITGIFELLSSEDKAPHRGIWKGHTALFTAATLYVVIQTSIFGFFMSDYGKPGNSQLRQNLLAYSEPDDPVIMLTTIIYPTYPFILQNDRENINPYIMAHPIIFSLKNYSSVREVMTEKVNIPEPIQTYLDNIGQVIEETPPRLLYVDSRTTCIECPYRLHLGEYLDYLGFTETYITPNYEYLGEFSYNPNYRFQAYLHKSATE